MMVEIEPGGQKENGCPRMKTMNVAIFASAFYPHVGGVEELVRQLGHTYMAKGLRPIILTNRWPRDLPAYEEFEGIPTYRLPLRTPESSLKSKVSYKLTHSAIRRAVVRILRKHAIGVMHVQCVGNNGYYAMLAKRDTDIPLVVSSQGERQNDSTGLYQRSVFMNQVMRSLLEEADQITACSQSTLDELQGYYHKSFGPRARVVLNGISMDDFTDADPYVHPRPYILGIGRHIRPKGFDILLRSFALAGAALSGHDLLMAGDGVERAALEKLTDELGIRDRVKFMGQVDRRLAVRLFKGCELFVLPSRIEPLGIVNLEAMAAGKAVVASNNGGVPEIVADGETGLLVPPEDAQSLAKAICELIGDSSRREAYAAAGLARVQNYTWPAIADQYIEIYDRAIGNGHAAAAPVAVAQVG
jgi:glycosyltransferase involved in cell wall biosynthesis